MFKPIGMFARDPQVVQSTAMLKCSEARQFGWRSGSTEAPVSCPIKSLTCHRVNVSMAWQVYQEVHLCLVKPLSTKPHKLFQDTQRSLQSGDIIGNPTVDAF